MRASVRRLSNWMRRMSPEPSPKSSQSSLRTRSIAGKLVQILNPQLGGGRQVPLPVRQQEVPLPPTHATILEQRREVPARTSVRRREHGLCREEALRYHVREQVALHLSGNDAIALLEL